MAQRRDRSAPVRGAANVRDARRITDPFGRAAPDRTVDLRSDGAGCSPPHNAGARGAHV